MSERLPTTAIVLCGGRGSRLGGVDKPLVELGNNTLLGHVIERLRPQVDAVLLSCARPSAAYETFGHSVIVDHAADQGPLGGLVSALPEVQTPWVLTTAADTPFLPRDLVASLAPACHRTGAAVVTAGGHRQNLALLFDHEHARGLVAFYQAGGRAIHRWLVANAIEEVELGERGFMNVNTPADLSRAKSILERH